MKACAPALALALVVAVCFTAPAGAADLSGRASVTDGDTIEVAGEEVRFQGIDAPETGQPHGRAATRALRDRIGGERVKVEAHGRGSYGRVIGTVRHGGDNINLWLVRRGHAWVYDRYADDPRLPELEHAARRHDRGLWARAEPIPPWDWRDGERHGSVDTTGGDSAGRDRDCSDFDTWEAAQAFFEDHQPGDPHRLDGNGDGVACEGLR